MNNVVKQVTPAHLQKRIEQEREADFSYFVPGIGRFRTNLFQQRGQWCLAMRYVKTHVPSFEELGLLEQTKKIAESPRGIVLLAGSTGCGKSTTLAAMIEHINANFKKHIVTLEDPIEYVFEDNQCVVEQREVGLDTLSFHHALKHILRQDPDIIMIGEIRDTETAEIAVEAALTGHQVLSTMHCNDAAGAISRLDDMEIAPFLISSSVILACGQRLMRRICNNCKEPVTYPEKMFSDLGINATDFEDGTLFRGRGCERCKNSGYTGRLAIIEAMTMTDEIRKLVIKRVSASEIAKVAIEQGMKTLRMVALEKAREGASTLEQTLLLTSGES
jgi:type II secretory ATPase GspE/PulE/Tfp pilus assembly ATPase PilB-like protein